MKIDMHVHSRYSEDGSAEIEEIIRAAKRKGLDGIAITDHNTIDGWDEAIRLGKKYGIIVVRGEEVSSKEGHILAYGISHKIEKGMSADETVKEIKQAGGVAVAAHPFRVSNGVGGNVVRHINFDCVEAINSWSPPYINRKAEKLAKSLGLPVTGGSDAHRTDDIGRAYTVFPDDVKSEYDVIKSMKQGRVSAGGSSQEWGALLSESYKKLIRWVKRGRRI